MIWMRKKTGVPVIRLNSVQEAEGFLKMNHMFVLGLFDKYEVCLYVLLSCPLLNCHQEI